ncbi:MAG: hypothetical protein Kapaf2KO_15390 [Candidatus Kapaibacteriales bacterium]
MTLPNDPMVLELLPEFLETWIDDMENKYLLYVSDKNIDEMYRLAHTMKGSCYQFGLDDLGDRGVELMGYVKSGEWEKVEQYHQPILKRFVEIDNYLKSQ